MITTINFHQIVSVRAERRIKSCGHTWRNIILTDIDGSEVKIVLFPAAQISIIDEEEDQDELADREGRKEGAR
jgi:hypothetical protein